MKNEIIGLLKKEGELPDETIEEADIQEFTKLVEELGRSETEYIKASIISKDLNTTYIAKNLYVYHEVSSTNTIAKFLSENGIENGSVIIAEKQNGGKGRSGKTWQSPLGGIWLSIILNQDVDHSKIPLITLATGVAVAKTLEKIGIENAEIKWPNDIMIDGKKVCGILTEAVSKFNTVKNVIIGVGIDVNLNLKELPEELQNETTTIKNELGRKISENQLIKLFLEEFEKISELFNHHDYEMILKEWRKQSYSIGKMVEVRKPYHKNYDGYVIGISREGALVVEKTDGSFEKVMSGECIIKK